MKLISLYIENFGCLSQYTLKFKEQITSIEEPNGFGKTTLAEFIRAMFYGLPRKSKFLQKDLRTKYMPWQGGKYGGNLVFEHQGNLYKIERTFGLSAKSDTFTLYDHKTHRKSLDYSENIGTELFELDADSFERSTYMPQMREIGSLTTDKIQAKLGNLVEDTNDINNFEKAISALKAQRSLLIPYRGNGGSVAKAQDRISEIQNVLSLSEPLPKEIESLQLELMELRETVSNKAGARESIRQEITTASEAAARETILKQYHSLEEQKAEADSELHTLEERYPNGIPDQNTLEDLEHVYNELNILSKPTAETSSLTEAQKCVVNFKERFKNGCPSSADIRKQQKNCQDYITADAALSHSALSSQEYEGLEQLTVFFTPGVPDSDALEELQQKSNSLQELRIQVNSAGLAFHGKEQLDKLHAFFRDGVPTQSDIQEQHLKLTQAADLRQKNLQLASVSDRKPVEPKPAAKNNKKILPLMILSIVLIILSIVSMAVKIYIAGGICLVIGILLFILSLYWKLKQSLVAELHASSDPISPISQEKQALIHANEEAAFTLEQEVLKFVNHYLAGEQTPSEKLVLIQSKIENLQLLETQYQEALKKSEVLTSRLHTLELELTEYLNHYFPSIVSIEEAVTTLKDNVTAFKKLKSRKEEMDAKADDLRKTLQTLQNSISDFLCSYGVHSPASEFSTALTELQSDCSAFQNAIKILKEREQQETLRKDELCRNQAIFQEILDQYHLQLSLGDTHKLQELRDDCTSYRSLSAQAKKLGSSVASYYAENKSILNSPDSNEVKDLDSLKAAEKLLSSAISDLSKQISALEQKLSAMQEEAEDIPRKQDELEYWMQKKADDIKKAELLDKTMEYLQISKDALSNSYLGKLKSIFAEYMSRLTDLSKEDLCIDNDLDVQVENMGQSREMGYFSAGQSDLIILCMRLALVDTLFEGTNPFIILDDPFVNLDDQHTARALKLLDNLSQDHQILYLFCNSSRRL